MGQYRYTLVHGRSDAIPNAYLYTRTQVELHVLVQIQYLMFHGYYWVLVLYYDEEEEHDEQQATSQQCC